MTAVAYSDDVAVESVADQLSSHGYRVRHTPHFVIGEKTSGSGGAILLHTFNETNVDQDLSSLVADELGPLGIVESAQQYGDTLLALVASTCPASLNCPRCGHLHFDLPAIWRHYCLNTLHRMRALLTEAPGTTVPDSSQVVQFATVYRAVMRLCTGSSLLDVGSNLGLLPVLLAERHPDMRIVGCEIRRDAVASAIDLAEVTAAQHVTFLVRDVLDPGFHNLGRFDTVTALHLLEHLSDEDIATALTSLLHVTVSRLIVAVPYGEHAQALYGHEQMFTPERLDLWGRWCVETLGGGRYRREDVSGGLLIVDCPTAATPRAPQVHPRGCI